MPPDCIDQKRRIGRIAFFRLSGAAAVLRACVAIAGALPFEASPGRAANADEPPAFQGHGAEMHMRDEADDARRRALYFDGVAIELGPLGLPCDHLVKRRPQATAGAGYVVLLSLNVGGAEQRARIWIPPGGAASLAQARNQARDSVLERARGATITELDAKEFIWCR